MNQTSEPAAEPPSWAPTPAEYDDVALALDGILTEVTVVVPEGLLPAGAAAPRTVELTDVEGTPVALLEVAACEETAPGRPTLRGTVTPLAPREDGVFRHLHRTPAQVRAGFAGRTVAAVPVDAPLDTGTLGRLAEALEAYDEVVLLPLVGAGSPRVVPAHSLVRATAAAARLLPGAPLVVPVPLARRDDPGDDASRRALVARAYGEPVALVPDPRDRSDPGGQSDLHNQPGGGPTYPEPVAAVVEAAYPSPDQRGLVVFFTGLSGSGKSTLARRLHDVLLERGDRTVTLLDGDVVRRMLSAGLGFSKADREANITRIGFVAAEVARHGGLAICAPIAPYASTRAVVRQLVADAGGDFVLVHVATPLAECERRDRKGLYARARAGQIKEFTGISDPYEEPVDADLAVDTSGLDVDEVVTRVLDLLIGRGSVRAQVDTPEPDRPAGNNPVKPRTNESPDGLR